MSTEKMREEFEVAFVAEEVRLCGEGMRSSALYMIEQDTVNVTSAWWAWQASRAAIEVELRDAYMKGWEASGEGWNHEHPGMTHETESWQRERDEALGIKP